VRFLWQTDAASRILFVSPGLAQVVGRNAEIVGERWQDASLRLRLDPTGRIAEALANRDTWSGLTAWWPIEGSNVRVPAELTALPVFGGDQSFQGYRGFGVLKAAEALMPAAFEARFGSRDAQKPTVQTPPYEESIAANVVPIRADLERMADHARLSHQEKNAFEEIAEALRSRIAGEAKAESDELPPPESSISEVEAVSNETADGETEAPAAKEPPPPALPALEARISASVLRSAASAERAEARLRLRLADVERRLQEMTAVLDTAMDGVLIVDAEGVIESVNGSAEALFGLDERELVGAKLGDLLTPESEKLALDYLSGLRDSGVASLLNEGRELEARAGVGAIPLFMTMGRLSGEEGGRFCAVLRDITHWKRTESELVAAKRAAEAASTQKSEFLARVSHEIRTPLNAIIGFAEVMIEERFGPVENERYREYLRDVRTSGEHVVSLVNDLLDISKIEAGKLDLDFTAVPLNELVRESINLMQPQANRARVVLRSSLSQEVPAIVADHRTMRQIVLNLLSNSVKFTGPGGQVIASTRLAENGEALLRIRDTGEGMSEEELTRALEPFRQLSTATLSDSKGTGLGLPLTKALVESNRARLSIRSARGEGTVVTVTFPPTRVLSE
jgi:PAS domain S-box-containing protein